MTGLIIWHETWIRDSDTLWETVMAIADSASRSFIFVAVGTGVFLDVLIFAKTIFLNAKWVIGLLSEILKDAIQRQKAETERREREERLQEEVSLLRQEISELKERLSRKRPSS
jgi:ABC-type iron transport system FetAB permease component